MALLFTEGFDWAASNKDLLKNKWNSIILGVSDGFITGRYGGYALNISNSTAYLTTTIPSSTSIVIGFNFQYDSLAGGTDSFLFFKTISDTIQCGVGINDAGNLLVFRGTTSNILGTSSIVLSENTWYHIAIKLVVHNTTGAVTVKIDDVTDISVTNVDTQNHASLDTISTILFDMPSNFNMKLDDIYILDTTGSAPQNDFLGIVRIQTLLPNTDGTYSEFDGSDGNSINNYALVNEQPSDSTSTYVEASVAGKRDSYNFSNLDSNTTGIIYGVNTQIITRKSEAGSAGIKTLTKSSATVVTSTTIVPSTDYAMINNISVTDPNTLTAWTRNSVDSAEFGFEKV